MTIQITVRLPDDLVAFADQLIASGLVTSRADAVSQALAHERRRQQALADAEIYRTHPDADMDALAAYTAAHPVNLD